MGLTASSSSADAAEAPSLAEGTRVGRYLVEAKLGAGQMGDVYAARTEDGARVALKLLRPAGSARRELETRFRREAELCRSIRHPHVVAVSDYGVHDDGSPFFAMPLLRGADLDTWLTRTGALAPEVAVTLARQACAGLAAAHARGVVHRDFKPANVFVDERDDGSVQVVVCDFGVAKVFDEDGALTASGAVLGTPLYMAPEQLLDSKRVDARCDVWALGMVLYHALTGRAAFADARGIGDLVVLLRDGRVPPLQAFAPWVPPGIARVVHAALLPVEHRIASAAELADALAAWGPRDVPLTTSGLVPVSAAVRASVATRAALPTRAAELGRPEDATVSEGRSPVARSAPPPDPLVGALVAGRYRVGAVLGGGGMGRVYEAVDESASASAREVALKVMTAALSGGDAERRFLREARAAARIAHPHVTKVLDSGVDASTGAPFLVMERLRGHDLASYLTRYGALEPGPVVTLFVKAAEGLAAAHAMGIVHRDVKPSNLFVHEVDDGTAVVKICDFGIAKQLESPDGIESTELTRTGGLLGSPLYMSPEQAKNAKSLDARSDVFSFSLSLHEALSGQRPWPGRTSMGEIILAVCTEDVPPLSTCAPWIPRALSDVVARGLARDPATRWSSMTELAAALVPFAGDGAPLMTAALVGASPERRARVEAAIVGGSSQLTADPVSVGARTERRRPLTMIYGAIAAAAAAAVVVATLSRGATAPAATPRTTSTLAPPPTAEPTSPMPTASSAPVAAATPPVSSSAPSAAPAVSVPRATSPRRMGAAARTGATASGSASASPRPATASSVGRGVTATDLPP